MVTLRWCRGPLTLATVLAAVGCSEPRVVIGDLAQAGDDLSIDVALRDGRLTATIRVRGVDCVALGPTLTGSLDGADPPIVVRGSDPGPDFPCTDPAITFTSVPTVGSATLRVADASRTIDVALSNLLLPRSAVINLPADGQVAPGDEVVIDWTPATDVNARSLAGFSVFEHSYITGGIARAALATRGAQVVATAPASPNIPAGDGDLTVLYVGPPGDAAIPCAGIACTLSLKLVVIVEATYGP